LKHITKTDITILELQIMALLQLTVTWWRVYIMYDWMGKCTFGFGRNAILKNNHCKYRQASGITAKKVRWIRWSGQLLIYFFGLW